MKISEHEKTQVLDSLAVMSRNLGSNTDFIILAEGNTSARCDDESFYVKASGKHLRTIEGDGFVEVYFEPVLDLVSSDADGDDAVATTLVTSKVNANITLKPSIETLFHAFLLSLPDINFVGHIHATSVNSLMCSNCSNDIYRGRIFPDEIVVCGPEPVVIPYRDPGLPLARELMNGVTSYQEKWGMVPKLILMENHGMIALGATAQEVEAICAMADKTARVLLGALTAGGPRYMTDQNVERIHTRPDELIRLKQIRGEKG
jgi:rhamnose utilization protein RhaD (predicted bifunctional aldolase and dehydrogenase)